MTISAADIERIARLAGLDVEQASLPDLTRQLARILDYVSRLESVAAVESEVADVFRPGPVSCPRRPDTVHPALLAIPPEALAPTFVDGLFIVPRPGVRESA